MSATKRKRVDDHEGAQDEPKVQSEIWYSDGNVVLEAQGTQFRVHRGLLAKHSSVFRDMFDVPQPPDEATVDGCPVVHLSDTSEDVGHLLNALYDWFYHSYDWQPISILAAMIRLGHKYNCKNLQDDALSRLKYEFPDTLDAFTAKIDVEYERIQPLPNQHEMLQILNLARECRLQRILPAVYINLSNAFTMDDLISGIVLEDGTSLHITQEDKLICAVGFERLRQATWDQTFSWLSAVPYDGCTLKSRCSRGARKIHFQLFGHPTCNVRGLDPWNPKWAEEFCDGCGSAAKEDHNHGRTLFWDSLPPFFELPEWGKLTYFG